MAFQDGFPCIECSHQNRPMCIYADEHNWDWDTDDICPGFFNKCDDKL